VPPIELRDRSAIAALLRRDPRPHVYELGDLDDVDWPFTRWFGWESEGGVDGVVLLYTQPIVPVLLAIADDPAHSSERNGSMAALIGAIRGELPEAIYVHVTAPLLEVLAERYVVERAEPHLKLALGRTDLVAEHAAPVELLTDEDLEEIRALYAAAYPGGWFEPRQLRSGRYVGIRHGDRLACIAGVHVHSPRFGVAALGNVATLPELRGRGLARGACAALCNLLLGDGIGTIGLNVHRDNLAAIRAYTRLGFELVAEYTEARLVARS
jgi:RimJ/RimL family protein N-acetyltransferase